MLTDPGTILVKLKKFLNSDFIKNPKKYLKKERLPRKYDYASTLKKKLHKKKISPELFQKLDRLEKAYLKNNHGIRIN